MSQELNSIQPKFTLAELSVQLVLSQPGQDGADMLCMLFFILGIYQDVIDEATTNLSNSGIKIEFMRYIKNAGAFVRPKDMTRYSYNPYLVEKVVFVISCGQIFIW
jgi:hypothetical protein